MKKVQVYTAKESYCIRPNDDTTYIVKGLKEHPSDFEVNVSHEPDPELVKNAEVVFCRFEIPVNKTFLRALIPYEDEGTRLFINSPSAKLYESSKRNLRFLADTEIIPKTKISSNPEELVEFANSLEGKLIVKPIDLNGGKGIKLYNPNKLEDNELYSIANRVTANGRNEVVFQSYIDGVEKLGDKRLTIFLYEPIAISLRIPPEGSYICNFSTGGTVVATEINERDRYICETIKPMLIEKGITLAGIDIIGPYLSEINVSSPGGMILVDKLQGNTNARDKMIDLLKQYKI